MRNVNQSMQLSHLGSNLNDSLSRIDAYESELLSNRGQDTIHIPTVGSALSSAYEQLRNASEYSEGDLLQQRAIRRYLKRVLSFHTQISTEHLADELIVELTQSEYIPNDHTTMKDVKAIKHYISLYYGAYWKYAKKTQNQLKRSDFQKWILDVLAVRCEQTLQSHVRQLLFAHFAFSHLHNKIDIKKLIKNSENISNQDMSIIVYASIHRSLLKSDDATIRTALIDTYKKDVVNINEFVDFNLKIDNFFETQTIVHTTRVIGKNGAPLRFIYTGFFKKDAPLSSKSLQSPELLEQNLHRHIESEYAALNKKLDVGIVRSIIFLLITKGIIGFVVEVPYDILISGSILWIPFFINLLFPATFIAFSRLTLTTPIKRNTTAVITSIKRMLFSHDNRPLYIRSKKQSQTPWFNIVYIISFVTVFFGVSYLLFCLKFNFVQGVIFFMFLSTASFLAFRLSRQIHELEVVNTPQGLLALIRDIIYLPFIYVGQQISYRYSKINIVAMVLDLLIELPLKTILRLIRQWTLFLNQKKDELI